MSLALAFSHPARARTCLAGWILALTVAPGFAAAPEARSGAIGGVVVSELTQHAVEGATVVLEPSGLETRSDAAGRFLLSSVPEGTYRMVVSREGSPPVLTTGIVVSANRETPLMVRLQERIAIEEKLSVSASAFEKSLELTNGAFAMSYEEVRRAPGALADINRMIQALPGVTARDDGRNDIVARGGSPAENLTLVDGVEVPNLSHFGGQGASSGPITMLNAELVSDASFLAGGFPAQYGNRLSSVLEVQLREGSRRGLEAEFDLGMAGAGLVVEGPLARKGSWLLSARRSYIDLIADAYGLTTVPQYANYQAKAVYDLAPGSRLSLISLGGWDTIDYGYDPEDLDDPNTVSGGSTGWRGVTGLTWRHFLGGAGVATLSASHALSLYEVDAFDQQRAGALLERNRSREDETTLRADLALAIRRGSLRFGGSAKRLAQSLEIAMPSGVENPFSAEVDARINQVDVDADLASWQLGGHVQLSQRLVRFATLTLGTRYDRFAVTADTAWSPRAGLTIHLHPKLDLSTSLGRYHQSPALVLFDARPENATLRPIRAEHATGGLEWRVARDVKLSLEVYRKRYSHYPVSTELPFLTMADMGEQYEPSYLMMPLVSRGEGRSSGIELFAQKKIGGRLWGQVSYAYSRTEQRALDRAWRRGGFDLPHVLSVVAGTKLTRRLELSSKFSFSSGRPMTPILEAESLAQNRLVLEAARFNEERAPAYHRLDLRVDHRTSHRWGNLVAYVELDNVYDRDNVRTYYWNPKTRERYAMPQNAFMVVGGINVEF